MTERKKDMLIIAALLAVMILFFSKILFTQQIIRAPDIINEFYWGVKGIGSQPFWSLFKFNLSTADWNLFINSGHTNEGGMASLQFLLFQRLIFWIFPAPASVAWYIVFHLFIGAAGTYCYCRLIGTSRMAALLGGLIFSISPESASLINAGHVMKIATISFAPWAFYFLEKGFQTRRVIFFLTTAVVLAYQFFHTHWQIAFYTCLGMALYAVIRLALISLSERTEGKRGILTLLGFNLVLLFFFLSTVAISLAPLANWSKGTNRGSESGANTAASSSGSASQPKGGLNREEAMSWSLPPEELGALVIPGLFGLSRQEAGPNPESISSYYWGRMRFTQTVSYLGLLPLLLLPLPLIFRRDQITWIALTAVVVGLLFSMGKYTPFYNLLFDYFPGINRFRVPKMIMFLPVFGAGVLAARGLDLLCDENIRKTKAFFKYLIGVCSVPLFLLIMLGAEIVGSEYWIDLMIDLISQPTRYEQGAQLIGQRWNNIVAETGLAAVLAALFAALFAAYHWKRLPAKMFPYLLLLLFLCDVGRINNKFMFLVDEPHRNTGVKPPQTEYLLGKKSPQYRTLPMDGSDPMQYATAGIPVMFTSNPVQQMRWQQYLDNFSLISAMPDILNVKYLIFPHQEYLQQKAQMGDRFVPVFTAPDGSLVILENRHVLPKGWLVPSVALIPDPSQRLAILQNPQFNPATIAMVESQPPIPMADPNSQLTPIPAQNVSVPVYTGERIVVEANAPRNALLVLGEKYYKGWQATVDGINTEIVQVNHILRGVYLTPGNHKVEFRFDPLPFRIGKYLTLVSFAFFAGMLVREWINRGKRLKVEERRMRDEGETDNK
ncbi:MAG: YfhO family protein [Desulfuromonadaceae bacterium]|nr:YfhO family protein [Desulfuromonadaceae bacterium]MDD5107517.1 YfhO family protein [Desulfuromonadaceae bacterium]